MRVFMRVLIAKIKYEAKLSISKRYMIPILLIAALALGFVQKDVSEYKGTQKEKKIFQETEAKLVDIYPTYRHYATYGLRILLMPASLSILFTNSTVLQDMTASIFPDHRLQIYQSLNGKNTYKSDKYMFADFSGILFFFGSLIALFYGFAAFSNKEYERLLSSITGEIKDFSSTIIARAIMLGIFTLIIIIAALLLIDINGISIGFEQHLLSYFTEIFFVSIFFLVLGSVFGAFKFQIMGLIGALGSWFSFLYIVPLLVSIIVAAQADIIKPEFQLEIEKLKLLMNFEKQSNEKAGILGINQKTTDIDRELVLSYSRNEFPKIQALEKEMKTQMQAMTILYYQLSSYFPTTSYWASINEISSRGYKTLDQFYKSIQQIKEAFFKEYMEKVYFSSQPEKIKVEPFLKGDENVFKGKPALPDYYLQGIFFNLLWIAALAVISFYRFKTNLFKMPEKEKKITGSQDVHLQSKSLKSWNIFEPFLYNHLYNLLSGHTAGLKKKGYDLQVFLNGRELNSSKKKQNFFAPCHPAELPGHLKVNVHTELMMDILDVDKIKRKEIETRYSLTSFRGKCFSQLDKEEQGRVFLATLDMKPFDIYLLNDVANDMPPEFCIALKDRMDALCDAGALVIFLYSDTHYLSAQKYKINRSFTEANHWNNIVKSLKDNYENETENETQE